jgi:hypothetical protein
MIRPVFSATREAHPVTVRAQVPRGRFPVQPWLSAECGREGTFHEPAT